MGRRAGGQGTGDRGARASDLADLRPGSVQTFLRPPRFSLKQQPARQLALALKVLAPSAVLVIHSSCHLALFAQEKLCKSLMHRVTSRHLSDASGSLSPVFKLTLLQPASQSSQPASFSSALVTSTQAGKKGSRSPFPPENIESKGSGLNTRASTHIPTDTPPLGVHGNLNPYSPSRLLFYYSSYWTCDCAQGHPTCSLNTWLFFTCSATPPVSHTPVGWSAGWVIVGGCSLTGQITNQASSSPFPGWENTNTALLSGTDQSYTT